MELFNNKLAAAIKLLGMDQKELSEATGIFPSSISRMISGERVNINPAIIRYLVGRRVNLNALYDDGVSLEEFTEIMRNPAARMTDPTGCLLCAEKDQRIRELNRHIDLITSLLESKG